MKTGKTFLELAQELDRQNKAKKDYLVDTRKMEMEVIDDKPKLVVDDLSTGMDLNDVSSQQIATHTGIPVNYFRKMADSAPDLLAQNVNHWFANEPAVRMLRTLDGRCRAFLSKSYRRIYNYQIAEAVMPILADIDGLHVESCEVTDSKMYIKCVNTRLETEVVPGDLVQSGICISNSEVGLGLVAIQPLVYRLVCTNGMIVNEASQKRRHVGRGNEAGENYELYSSATLAADDKALMMKIQDTVRATADEVQFKRVVSMMKEAKEARIESHDIPAVVELTGKTYGITKNETSGVLDTFIRNSDLTLYGLANAVTEHSQSVKSYDRATELEGIGYSILGMTPAQWKRISTAVSD